MAVAALVVSVIAIIVSVVSVAYTRSQAVSAAGALAIEQARRQEERRPELAGGIERTGTRSGRLLITLLSDEPLAGIDIMIPRANRKGVSFRPGIFGTEPAEPGQLTWKAFAYDAHSGERAGLKPRESLTWAVDVGEVYAECVQLEATCYGTGGEVWDSVLVEAEVECAIPGGAGQLPGFKPSG